MLPVVEDDDDDDNICGSTGSQYHSSNDTIRMLGIEHTIAKKRYNP